MPEHKLHKFQKFWRDGTDKERDAILRRRYDKMVLNEYAVDATLEEYIKRRVEDSYEFPKGWPMLDICTGKE